MSIFGRIKDAILGHAEAQQAQPAPAQAAPAPTQQVQEAQHAPARQVDIEATLEDMERQKGVDLNWRNSIVDLMKLIDLDPSLENRKELAHELGYSGELNGSAEMNIWLHRQVMDKLRSGGLG
ncbi:MAG: DUF3597 domain-containing protein [Sphingomonadaceae bacterium]|nr:DUF3597 domain-containing protein [Sphingomonadaceae bacterium]